jgi:hypothetical protein
MSALTWFLLSLSIALPATAALIRIKSIQAVDYPFLLCLIIGTIAEVVSFWLTKKGYSNTVIGNVYVFVESQLLVYQFYKWQVWKRRNKHYYFLYLILIAAWLYTGFVYKPWYYTNSYYRIVYSLVIVILSVDYVNRIVLEETGSMIKNYRFIICTGFITFYTLNILVETFYIYDTGAQTDYSNSLFNIKSWCNFFINLLYLLAVLWIPRKKIFISP